MKARIIIILVVAICFIWFLWPNKTLPPQASSDATQTKTADLSKNTAAPHAITQPITSQANTQSESQAPLQGSSEAEKWAWWNEMSKKDRFFEYKMPISFYGKVVDDSDQPVSGANIAFSWTDLSSEGTSQKNAISDALGYFSLTGATGKTLTVQVGKEGYKNYFSNNRNGFEYAMFAHSNYYQPNSGNPVVFRLRKNRPKEQLLIIDRDFPISTDQPLIFSLASDSSANVKFELLENKNAKDGAWSMRVSAPEGGVQISVEEFPFEAPEEGYSTSLVATNGMPKSPTWPGPYQGGEFYIKTPSGYGRVHLQMLASATHLSIVSYYNPSGSRNLEP